MPATFAIVYFFAGLAVSIYLLVLATRFVGARERIATALERAAQNLPRENK